MILNLNQRVINVSGITDLERQRINEFLLSLVNCWRESNPNEYFSIRSLMAKMKGNWHLTILGFLKGKYIRMGQNENDSLKHASIDAGWLLYSLIVNSVNLFESRTVAHIREYR